MVLDHCRGVSPVGTGEELAKPAEVPLLTGQVCCAISSCKSTVCSCQRAFHSVTEAQPFQASLKVGLKIK